MTTKDLASLDADADGLVAVASETYDPPTTVLDADGQGDPYAQFGRRRVRPSTAAWRTSRAPP